MIYMDLGGSTWLYIYFDGFHGFTRIYMDLHVTTWIHIDLHGFLCIYIDYMYLGGFTWICMDLEGISMVSGLGGRATCGALWRAVAASGGPCRLTSLVHGAGWLAGRWLAGCWMTGWLDGGGGHHRCNLARSMPRRVGGI